MWENRKNKLLCPSQQCINKFLAQKNNSVWKQEENNPRKWENQSQMSIPSISNLNV